MLLNKLKKVEWVHGHVIAKVRKIRVACVLM